MDGETVLTVGAQGGAAVSLQRGHVVKQTPGLFYYKPEALPGRSGSPLFNATANTITGVVAWRTGDGHSLAMNAVRVQSFVRGEVAESTSDLPNDAVPLLASVHAIGISHIQRMPTMRTPKAINSKRCPLRNDRRSNDERRGYNVQTTPR